MNTVVRVDKSGRLVLPVKIRRALGIEQGGDVVLTVEENNTLRVQTQATGLAQVQALVRAYAQDRMLSDELSAERREAARYE